MSEIEYDLSGKSKVSFQVLPEILNLSLLYSDFMFFQSVINTQIS